MGTKIIVLSTKYNNLGMIYFIFKDKVLKGHADETGLSGKKGFYD